jgi:hypothetical protein
MTGADWRAPPDELRILLRLLEMVDALSGPGNHQAYAERVAVLAQDGELHRPQEVCGNMPLRLHRDTLTS